jgi:hypothetical protein
VKNSIFTLQGRQKTTFLQMSNLGLLCLTSSLLFKESFKARPGAMKTCPEAMEARSGAMEAHPEAVDACPGAWSHGCLSWSHGGSP